jgi:hypothetical protein
LIIGIALGVAVNFFVRSIPTEDIYRVDDKIAIKEEVASEKGEETKRKEAKTKEKEPTADQTPPAVITNIPAAIVPEEREEVVETEEEVLPPPQMEPATETVMPETKEGPSSMEIIPSAARAAAALPKQKETTPLPTFTPIALEGGPSTSPGTGPSVPQIPPATPTTTPTAVPPTAAAPIPPSTASQNQVSPQTGVIAITGFVPQTSPTGPVAKEGSASQPLPAFTPVISETGPVASGETN